MIEQIQRGEDLVFQAYDRRSSGQTARFDAMILNGETGEVTFPQTTADDETLTAAVAAAVAVNVTQTAQILADGGGAETETILVTGAVSIQTARTLLSGASGAYAVTLAAPGALQPAGHRKTIRMSEASNPITLLLTNVKGAPGLTATFAAVGDSLVLQSDGLAWQYMGGSTAAFLAADVGLADSETVLVAGALAVDKYLSIIDGVSGSYAVTLAAPPANSLGRRKSIRKTAANTITLALTNIVGMIDALGVPVSTTATFTTAEMALVLESNGTKWVVVGSSAVGT